MSREIALITTTAAIAAGMNAGVLTVFRAKHVQTVKKILGHVNT